LPQWDHPWQWKKYTTVHHRRYSIADFSKVAENSSTIKVESHKKEEKKKEKSEQSR